jgi:hypothetical protein
MYSNNQNRISISLSAFIPGHALAPIFFNGKVHKKWQVRRPTLLEIQPPKSDIEHGHILTIISVISYYMLYVMAEKRKQKSSLNFFIKRKQIQTYVLGAVVVAIIW